MVCGSGGYLPVIRWVSEDNHRRQQARNHCHRIVYPGPDRTQRTRHKLSAHEMVSYEIRRYKYRENIRTETFVRSHPHTPWGEEPQRLPFRVGQSRAQTRRPTHLSPPAERMRGVRSATGRIFEHPPNPPCWDTRAGRGTCQAREDALTSSCASPSSSCSGRRTRCRASAPCGIA